jgi:hypothetical protein
MDANGLKTAKGIKIDGQVIYDLMDDTYIGGMRIPFYSFYITDEHELRLDLISIDMYGSTDYMELIMDMNGIINPFGLKKGDVLVSTEASILDLLLPKEDLYDELKQQMIDARKKHRIDPARTEHNRRSKEIENSKIVVPTLQPKNKPLIEIDGDYIKINPAF